MYLIGKLPNEYLIFRYGARMTEARKNKIYKELLKHCVNNYDIPKEYQTIERAKRTIESKFDKYSDFEWQTSSFSADMLNVINQNFKIIDAEL